MAGELEATEKTRNIKEGPCAHETEEKFLWRSDRAQQTGTVKREGRLVTTASCAQAYSCIYASRAWLGYAICQDKVERYCCGSWSLATLLMLRSARGLN